MGYISTFCWKPLIVQNALELHHTNNNTTTTVFMWSDSSTRFPQDPTIFANRMIQDSVDFAGRTSVLGMGENTHPDTYNYLNMSVENYKIYNEIAATHFLFRLSNDNVSLQVLQQWFDCASLEHCQKCMATDPDGPNKWFPKPIKGPPSTKYLVPRQDQAVLSLLIYKQLRAKKGNLQINNKTYMAVGTVRHPDEDIKSIQDVTWL